ncbi:MAG: outer-membrane lipoprotein carrier protein LolA [Spirochaetota bacterium]
MEKIIKNYSSFDSIKASIEQHVFYPDRSYHRLAGDYSATGAGLMRIDYYSPSRQTVINNKDGLFWYYPESETVFVSRNSNMNNESLPVFLKRAEKEAGDFFNLIYKGKKFHSFFKRAHVFDIELKNKSTFRIWVDPEKGYILKRYFIDSKGMETVKELYSSYIKVNGILIPTEVEVHARTSNGIVRTLTQYSNVRVNDTVNPSDFVFKVKSFMKVRAFDEN